jgi:methylated-DNA-[protein]-cysteine S-methyltransferase
MYVMTNRHFALFDTALGPCGLVWSARGIAGVQFPLSDEAATRATLRRRFNDAEETAPPPGIQTVIEAIVALLRGEVRDLTSVAVDDGAIPEFNRRVYAIARRIPHGRTMTYGEIARELGDASLAREVGQAMGENPTPIVVPCHRVLAAGNKMGGFSAPGGVRTKMRLLTIEGAQSGPPDLFGSLPWVAAPRQA